MMNELDKLKLSLAQSEAAFSAYDPIGAIPFVSEVKDRIHKIETAHIHISASDLLKELETPELLFMAKAFRQRYETWCVDQLDHLKFSVVGIKEREPIDGALADALSDLSASLFSENPAQDVSSITLLNSLGEKLETLLPLIQKREKDLQQLLSAAKQTGAERSMEIRGLRFAAKKRHLLLALSLAVGCLIGDFLTPYFLKSYAFNPNLSALKFVLVTIIAYLFYQLRLTLKVDKAVRTAKASSRSAGNYLN